VARQAKIQILYGLEINLPVLNPGELAFCTDTKKLYIGTTNGNVLLMAVETAGDMLKSIYDTDNDGIVDAAETVPWSGVTGKKTFPASTTSQASLTIPHGAAPSSPVNGDVWTTTSGLLIRINGVTKTVAFTDSWSVPSQAEAEAGTATTARLWTAQRVKQAIVANAMKKAPLTWGDLKGV